MSNHLGSSGFIGAGFLDTSFWHFATDIFHVIFLLIEKLFLWKLLTVNKFTVGGTQYLEKDASVEFLNGFLSMLPVLEANF